jgi:UDP-glucose 4-epimerase
MEGVSITVVTGGAGSSGRTPSIGLLELGHHVVVLDDFSTGKRENLQHYTSSRLHVIACDVGEGIFAALAPITAAHGPVERIVHLAAQVSVIHSIANPVADMRINYGGTLHVLEYARATGVRRVVMSSSAAVDGDVAELPVGEDARCRPVRRTASTRTRPSSRSTTTRPCTACRRRAPFNVYGRAGIRRARTRA